MKHCPHCGSPLADDASLCALCGTPLEQGAQEPTARQQPDPPQAPAPQQPIMPSSNVPVPPSDKQATPKLLIAAIVLLSLETFGCLGGLINGSLAQMAAAVMAGNMFELCSTIAFYLPAILGVIFFAISYPKARKKALLALAVIELVLTVASSIVGFAGFQVFGNETPEPAREQVASEPSPDSDGKNGKTDAGSGASSTLRATTPKGAGSFDAEYTFDGQINIALNQRIEGEGFAFTLENAELLDELYPENPTGAHAYFAAPDGYTYAAFSGIMTNTSDADETFGTGGFSLNSESPAFISFGDEGKNCAGCTVGIEADGSDLGAITVAAGASSPFKILVPIPSDETGNLGTSKLFISLDRDFQPSDFVSFGSGSLRTDSGGDYVYCLPLAGLL